MRHNYYYCSTVLFKKGAKLSLEKTGAAQCWSACKSLLSDCVGCDTMSCRVTVAAISLVGEADFLDRRD